MLYYVQYKAIFYGLSSISQYIFCTFAFLLIKIQIVKYILKISIIFLFAGILLSSCTSRKKITYLQNKAVFEHQDSLHCPTIDAEYHIQKGDLLHIDFYTPFGGDMESVSNLFQQHTDNKNNAYGRWTSDAVQYLNGFLVDKNGEVTLPLIGRINITNKTVMEARSFIEQKANEYIKGVLVNVKLISFDYTILGEVTKPGVYRRYNTRLNLFEALATAGDITINGDKTRIKIIRENENSKDVFLIDATSSDIVSSQFFYIQPNDIIYVEPLGNKSFRQNLPNISILLSSISTIILVLNFINRN